MQTERWIYFPEESEDGAWTGRIWSDANAMGQWRFEAIRIVEENAFPYATGVFGKAAPVIGLVDFEKKATLVRPLVERVEPGNHHFPRTKLAGSFQAFLEGTCVDDENEALFASVSFESRSFSAWYGSDLIRPTRDDQFRTRSIDLAEPSVDTCVVDSLGTVEVASYGQFSRGDDEHSLRTRTVFRLRFEELRSLSYVMDVCVGLESLFGFLVGYRPPMPVFQLLKPRPKEDPQSPEPISGLRIGGAYALEGKAPHPLERLHMRGRDGASLEVLLKAYMSARVSLDSRIHAIQYSKWFGATLNDQFAAVMPVFEELVKARFKNDSELSYEHLAQAFWAYVDEAPDPDLVEFAKKHLDVKDKKSPGLPALIGRAIESINAEGFSFEELLAKRINKRRAEMFHTTPFKSGENLAGFYEEKLAITDLLMLLTLKDLGVSLPVVAKGSATDYHRFSRQQRAIP
ncbi:hypothetical protein [Mesorhizobium sp. SP-1A]|uniref:ApeA N-terminal domain 1-containing protein n=1 Tax=Mesorhizobium sp. SP-1A TaxID=3077840 RepID=UPI0028F6D768|nr:hypothetical protein [Mesorhizobium sp. SP-1A]